MLKVIALFSLIWFGTGGAQHLLPIDDHGWRLWPDTAAVWQNDPLFLPGEYTIETLPVNPPTGGWDSLSPSAGVEISLPATVEQYFWGKFGFADYRGEYYFENSDNPVKNGNYKGVSWWWKTIDVPADFTGEKIFLCLRGARQRAEVFINQKLVGYTIIAETSFRCDVTDAIRPGRPNTIAVRITN
ncbi:hypothetical protein JW992_13895, partial [candidate division KSB1 bacterium]|nr:hypothetical protein [candidate division KSB1 bacterium]